MTDSGAKARLQPWQKSTTGQSLFRSGQQHHIVNSTRAVQHLGLRPPAYVTRSHVPARQQSRVATCLMRKVNSYRGDAKTWHYLSIPLSGRTSRVIAHKTLAPRSQAIGTPTCNVSGLGLAHPRSYSWRTCLSIFLSAGQPPHFGCPGSDIFSTGTQGRLHKVRS